MGSNFKETSVNNINRDKFDEGWERIYGKKTDEQRVMENRKNKLLKEIDNIIIQVVDVVKDFESFCEAYPDKRDEMEKLFDKYLNILDEE